MAVKLPEAQEQTRAALERAVEHLCARQHEHGWWQGELETNVTMDAEDMLLREFLGVRRQEATERTAQRIRSQQRPDGTWANFFAGPGDLSTTIEAYWALRLAGDSAQDEHMRSAATFIREMGGLECARVFTHIWLALFGLWSWEQVPALPPEIILLPSWFPLNIYDFGCWARQTIVALSLVIAERPVRPIDFELSELRGAQPWQPPAPTSAWGSLLTRVDRVLHRYERRPIGWLRRVALARAERWVVRRQEADGSWGGIQPPWVYSLMALQLRGYALDHPVMRRGLEGIDGFIIEADGRRLEACQSPVWDTALAVVALSDAGLAPDHPALLRAAEWLLDEEVTARGDWEVRRRRLAAGGWSFEHENDNYPDIDDTAEVVLALRRVAMPDPARTEAAIQRALTWTEGMQSRDGGWGAFDADNTRTLVRELPFCDFGEVIDDPSADVSAHAIEMLSASGRHDTPGFARGVHWLCQEQEADGSWYGRWGVNYVYGTGAAVPALIDAGLDRRDPVIRRAVGWLESHQNADGGWGEDPRSYVDSAWVGRGTSTPSQTAWALLALHAAGERSVALERGLRWLVDHQRTDGTWDEPQYTGTGFPGDYYINYHLYRLTFPIMALGRCLTSHAR